MSGEIYEMIKKEPNKDYQLSFLLEDIVRQIEEKTIDYDQKIILLSEKDDPFHEITLNYLLWRKDKKYDNARKALELLDKWIGKCFKTNWFYLGTFSLEMFFRICRETNQKEDYIKKWIHEIFAILLKYEKSMNTIHVLKICEVLLNPIDRVGDASEYKGEIESIIKILEGYSVDSEKNNKLHLQRGLIELIIEFYRMLSKDTKKLEEKIILSFEKEADSKVKEDNNQAASWFYNEALIAAKNFGFREHYEQIKKKLINAGKNIKYNEIKIPINAESLIKHKLDQYKEYSNPLAKAIRDDSFIITDRMIDEVIQSQADSLSSLIPKVTFDEQGIRIASSNTSPNIERANAMKLSEVLSKIMRINVMKYIIDQMKIDDIISIIDSKDFLNDTTKDLLKFGLEKIKEKDYVCATHIIIPQIEATLRDIITNHLGLSGIRFRRYTDGYEYITLGSILKGEQLKDEENDKIKKYLGSEFRNYLYFKLVMSEGENLRDDFAHGILKKEKMNYEMSLDMIYLIMRIIQ